MGILSGIISYIFGLALNLLDVAITGFLSVLGFDLNTFERYFPAVTHYYDVVIGFGVGLLFMMLIFQIFRNFGVMLDMEAEDPLKMVGKTFLFFGMIMYSRSINNFIISLLVDPYSIFLNAAPSPYEFRLLTLVTAMFTSVFSNPFMAIVALILMLILGWQFLKLIIECVERYIVFCFILHIAPVVFATGAFKSTGQIFKSWCRMLGSQAMLLLLNIWSIQLFLSFLPVFERNMYNIIFNFLIGYAFLRFAQKADTLLRILGLNTASTGDMMRSFGGTIASVVFAVKAMSGAVGSIAAAAGKVFGGGAAAAGAAAGTAGGAVAGMAGAGAANSANMAAAGAGGSVAASAMGPAKQGYVNDVMNSAKNQMNGNPDGSVNMGSGGQSGAQRFRYEEDAAGGLSPEDGGAKSGVEMDQKGIGAINGETREGLSNIAHGLPHNKYDPAKRSFSGGGFPEFTGENANIIGASQLSPADGFEQHSVKMRDGSTGTLYQNRDTGEAHFVQFGSVDNGVIQGTISQVDKDTGQFSDFMGFKAVHQSVPGAESFSGHSVPIADSEGGVYHVSTGADASFFALGPASGGLGNASSNVTVSSHETSSIPASSIGSPNPFGGGSSRGSGAGRSNVGNFTNSGQFGGRGGNEAAPSGGGLDSERSGVGRGGGSRSAESPPVGTSMGQQPDDTGRFSKNNPANMEVFRRENSGVESFDRSRANPDTMSNMGSSDEK